MALITELYKFTKGTQVFGFAPRISTYSYLGVDYRPTIITRGRIKITSNFLKNTLTVNFPRTNSFARDILKNNSNEIIDFTLYRNNNIYWQGIVVSAEARGAFIELSCVSTYAKTTRPVSTAKITIPCRHTLFGFNCKAILDDFKVISTVVSTDSLGTTLTLSGIAQPSGYFLLGEIIYGIEKRLITKHVGQTLKILTPFNSPPVGEVILLPGCDHAETTCANKFNNLINYGGFSKLPKKDPHSNQGLL